MPLWNTTSFNAALFGGAGAPPGPIIEVGRGLLYPALRKAAITIGPQRSPSTAQFQDAIDELNRLLGSLNCDPLWIYGQDILSLPLSGQKIYTIGIDPTGSIGSDFAVPVPKGITEAVYASDGLRYPLAVLTPQLWSRIGLQDVGTIPQGIYFDRGYPIANIYIHGQPAGGELELYVWHVIPGVQTLSDVVVIPPGYEDALVLNLAVRLAPHFQKEVHPDVRQQARESLMRLESINAPQPIASLDNWGSCGHSDAYGGVVVSGGGGSNGSGGGGTGPPGPPGPQGPAGPAMAVRDEGVLLANRPTLNFAGAGVTATDDAANSRTLITIPGGGGGDSGVTRDGIPIPGASGTTSDFKGHHLDVTMWGAKGDGVTDDTAAIAAAIAYASLTTVTSDGLTNTHGQGACVYFPAGDYLTGPQQVAPNMVIRGEGSDATRIYARATNQHIFYNTRASSLSRVTFEDFALYGKGPASGTGDGIHLVPTGADAWSYLIYVNRVSIYSMGGHGFYAPKSFSFHLANMLVTDSGDNAIEAYGSPSCSLTNCYVAKVAAGKTGYRIYSGDTTFTGCNGIDGVGSWGVFGAMEAEDGFYTYAFPTFIGCNIEDFAPYGVRFKQGSTGNFINTSFVTGVHSTTVGGVKAIVYDYPASHFSGLASGSINFYLSGAITWANGWPIHVTNGGSPFISVGAIASVADPLGANYYNDYQGLVYPIPSLEVYPGVEYQTDAIGAATLICRNDHGSPNTGPTQMFLQSSAAQGTTPLLKVKDAAGSVFWEIEANGDIGFGPTARMAVVSVPADGAADSGAFVISTRSLGTLADRVKIAAVGNVGMPTPHATYKLNVTGDCNITGTYRVNGTPISTGGSQTPWTSDIDGGGHSLTNVNSITYTGSIYGGNVQGAYITATTQLRVNIASPSYDGEIVYLQDGYQRWSFGKHGAESGGNSGSNFDVYRYSDAGGYLSKPFTCLRSNGTVGLDCDTGYFYVAAAGVERMTITAPGVIKMWLGGSLKTLSVDGSGFVKAT